MPHLLSRWQLHCEVAYSFPITDHIEEIFSGQVRKHPGNAIFKRVTYPRARLTEVANESRVFRNDVS